jgi:hypothetical protein
MGSSVAHPGRQDRHRRRPARRPGREDDRRGDWGRAGRASTRRSSANSKPDGCYQPWWAHNWPCSAGSGRNRPRSRLTRPCGTRSPRSWTARCVPGSRRRTPRPPRRPSVPPRTSAPSPAAGPGSPAATVPSSTHDVVVHTGSCGHRVVLPRVLGRSRRITRWPPQLSTPRSVGPSSYTTLRDATLVPSTPVRPVREARSQNVRFEDSERV